MCVTLGVSFAHTGTFAALMTQRQTSSMMAQSWPTTAPQPSSNALPMTLALVPGGPEPMTKGLGSFRPFTVVAKVGILFLLCEAGVALHQQIVQDEANSEREEPGIIIERDQRAMHVNPPAGCGVQE